MSDRPTSSLWLRLALPFLLFVVAGSTALALWLHASARRESRQTFATLARTNAELITTARLPANERVADYLGRVLNLQVFFRRNAWDIAPEGKEALAFSKTIEIVPEPAGELAGERERLAQFTPEWGITTVGRNFEGVAIALDRDTSLLLVRPLEPAWSFLTRGETMPLLGAFWLLSVALAWALARGFVRPLRLLAQRLPHIDRDMDRTLPGAERDDEIGQLARAYLATRAQLGEERARRQQVERLAILGRMATGLAHEIHNPLAAIRMHAQLIESAPNGSLHDAARESLPVLLGEAAKIEGLVQQWMFLARPQPPQTVPADLGTIVEAVVRAIAPQAAHADVTIACDVPAGLRAKVDARRLSQALGNIVNNAIQAMPRGGAITITGVSDDEVRLVVSDTGPGFSEAALARHPELFFSEKEGGMGIGLNVASEILKAHGGSLLVANAPGSGASVTLCVPITHE